MRQQKRLTQVGNIRALAILLVVLGHSIILYSSGWNLYETTRQAPFLAWLKSVIDIPQMPLFFSLSGYLFVFTHQKKQGFGQLAKKKLLRLIAPYFGIGLLFLLPIRLLVGYPGYKGISIADLALRFLTANDVGHLCFASIPNAHPAIVVFINFVIFGAASFGLTELVRKTKLKVLIGE